MPQVRSHIITLLTTMLHDVNPDVQTFVSLRGWAIPTSARNEYSIVSHVERRPTAQHIRRYNGPAALETATIIPGAEDGIVGRSDVVYDAEVP